MAELPQPDVSSYRQPPLKGPLDMVQQLQGVESAKLGIDQKKLDQVNQGYNYLLRELNSLGENPTPEDMKRVGQAAVNQGLITPEMFGTFISTMPTDPKMMRPFRDETARKLMSTQEMIGAVYGNPGSVTNNQQTVPTRQNALRGGPQAVAPPIQSQPGPTTPTLDASGRPRLLGAQPPQIPEGGVPAPGGIPGQYIPQQPLPVDQPRRVPTQAITRPQPLPTQAITPEQQGITNPKIPVAKVMQDRFPIQKEEFTPRGPVTGMSPLFEEGKKQYVEDQNLATQKLTKVQPAIQAFKMMDGLRSGPGTAPWNQMVAFAKANNIIPIGTPDDPTAIYQIVNKKLSQYVQSRGNRSDADLALAEESSPSIKQQISPALTKLTRDAIAQDRIEAARSSAFEGGNYEKYGEHRSTFPTKVDYRAMTVDLLTTEERAKLGEEMLKKKNTPEGKKFWDSLAIAKKFNLLEPIQ